jgi:hypothetical protein
MRVGAHQLTTHCAFPQKSAAISRAFHAPRSDHWRFNRSTHSREAKPVPPLKLPFAQAVISQGCLCVAVRTEWDTGIVGRLLAHAAVRSGVRGFAPACDPAGDAGHFANPCVVLFVARRSLARGNRRARLCGVPHFHRQALTERGECCFDVVQARMVVEIKQPVDRRFRYSKPARELDFLEGRRLKCRV